MTDKPIESFFKKAHSDADLRSRLGEVAEATSKEEAVTRVVSIAQAEGFKFTADEFEKEFDRRIGRLDPSELERVVGGGVQMPSARTFGAPPESPQVVIAIIAVLIG